MDSHRKKKAAPIIITIIMLLYFAVYFGIIISLLPWTAAKILFGIIPLVFGVCMICICIQRIKEIDGGEEDDLSKY